MSVLKDLLERRAAVQKELDDLLAKLRVKDEESGEERDRELTAEEETRSQELLADRKSLDKRIKQENRNAKQQKLLAEARATAGVTVETRSDGNGADMSVENETKVYGPGAPHSWWADEYHLVTRSPLDPVHQAAFRRKVEWSNQVEHELAGNTELGRRIEPQFRERFRESSANEGARGTDNDWQVVLRSARERGRVGLSDKGMPGVESRALTTGGGATASAGGGGVAAFVTPYFLEPDYVPYREFGRAFADAVTQRPVPQYGMTIYLPQITGPAAVSTSYSENGAVTETDPSQGYISAGLIITAGQVTTSQAILDRTGPNFEYDVVIWDQLQRDYNQKWDVYVLTQALANGVSQSYTGTFKVAATSNVGGLYGQVAQAKSTIRTTAGTVLNPNRCFMDPVRWEAVAGWADSQGRPIVVPNYAGPFNAASAGSSDGDVGIEGATGYRFAGLPAFTDHNIPTTGGTANQDQVLVLDSTQTWAYEGAPVHRVLPQTLGGNLEVIFQQYSYGAVLQRYNSAVVKINGAALIPPTFNN